MWLWWSATISAIQPAQYNVVSSRHKNPMQKLVADPEGQPWWKCLNIKCASLVGLGSWMWSVFYHKMCSAIVHWSKEIELIGLSVLPSTCSYMLLAHRLAHWWHLLTTPTTNYYFVAINCSQFQSLEDIAVFHVNTHNLHTLIQESLGGAYPKVHE